MPGNLLKRGNFGFKRSVQLSPPQIRCCTLPYQITSYSESCEQKKLLKLELELEFRLGYLRSKQVLYFRIVRSYPARACRTFRLEYPTSIPSTSSIVPLLVFEKTTNCCSIPFKSVLTKRSFFVHNSPREISSAVRN